MTLAALEFNDQSLQIQADGGVLYSEPGFARLTASGIETGAVARASAWQEPQHSYNLYWSQLNQAPLAARAPWARHHADIAFAQLSSMWRQAGSPESLLLLVPGSYTDPQLSLLLGMVQALPAKTVAILDNALAACLDCQADTLFVDLQLHQSVVSLVRPNQRALGVSVQEIIPDLGMMQILNSVARHISNLLIDSARYDPMHLSSNEQAIYDQLPAWLLRLQWEHEISATVQSEQGDMPFILRRDDLRQLMGTRLVNMQSILARHPGAQVLLSHASRLLTGVADIFASAPVAPEAAAVKRCLAQPSEILDQVSDLYRVQALSRGASSASDSETPAPLATHVLYRHQALPLAQPVSISINDSGVRLGAALDQQAALTVVLRNRQLEAVHQAAGLEFLLPGQCIPGESIMVEGHQIHLIEVRNG